MKRGISACLLMVSSFTLQASDLGIVGEIFPVREENLLHFIESRVHAMQANGQWEDLEKTFQHQVSKNANRPKPLSLGRAQQSTTHTYRPEIVLSEALRDNTGRILLPRGTSVNALEKLPFYTPCWLFFNGDDSAQKAWAKKARTSCNNPTLILTGGSVKDSEDALNAVIYFDQEGRITRQLHITQVPAIVTRQDNTLRIIQVAIKENGDAV